MDILLFSRENLVLKMYLLLFFCGLYLTITNSGIITQLILLYSTIKLISLKRKWQGSANTVNFTCFFHISNTQYVETELNLPKALLMIQLQA